MANQSHNGAKDILLRKMPLDIYFSLEKIRMILYEQDGEVKPTKEDVLYPILKTALKKKLNHLSLKATAKKAEFA